MPDSPSPDGAPTTPLASQPSAPPVTLPFDALDAPTKPFAPASESGEQTGPSPPGYELGEEVGRGGMGVVYRAHDTRLNRSVAVKILQDRYPPGSLAAQRFVEEARITAALQHPAIPPVHEVGVLPDGRPFLAMKLIKGRTLADLIAHDPPARGVLVAAFEQVCQAIAFAHDRGVIHRDLKPGNVMIGAFSEVQVMDWGLAKFRGTRAGPSATATDTTFHDPRAGSDDFAHTQAGQFLGTPAFMAPEQAIGAVELIDERTDVFGLGGILCAVLTGEPPFTGPSAEATRQLAARGGTAAALARLDAAAAEPELVALCKRCLSVEKADRPEHAGAVASVVAALRADAEQRARAAELEQVRQAEQRKRRRVQTALAASLLAVVVAAAAVGVVLVRHSAQEVNAVRVAGLVDKLLTAPPSELAVATATLEPHRAEVLPRLRAVLADPGADRQARLNAAVFIGDEPDAVEHLLARLPEVRPAELAPVAAALEPAARRDPGRFWAVVRDEREEFGTRIRHATVLAKVDPAAPQWAAVGGEFAWRLTATAAPADVGAWGGLLTPVRGHFEPALRRAIRDDTAGDRGFVACGLVAALYRDEPASLVDLFDVGSARQAGVVIQTLAGLRGDAFPTARLLDKVGRPRAWNPALCVPRTRPPEANAALPAHTPGTVKDWWSAEQHLFVDRTAADPEEPLDAAAEGQARAALALIAAGRGGPLWHLFAESPDPRVRTYLIHTAATAGIDPAVLVEQLAADHPASVRQGLLLALGEYNLALLSPKLLDRTAAHLLALYESDPDAGVHSACRWVLRQWGRDGPLADIDRRLAAAPAAGRGWYVAPNGATFAVVRGPVETVSGSHPTEWYRDWTIHRTEESTRRLIPRDFAVATTEVTVGQFQAMLDAVARRLPDRAAGVGAVAGGPAAAVLAEWRATLLEHHSGFNAYTPAPDCPAGFVRDRLAMAYCRWLGEVEGLSEEEQCYPPVPDLLLGARPKPDFVTRTGYRLPTEVEWEYACRAGTATRYPYGSDVRLLHKYSWHWPNTPNRAEPVGRLKPNGLGLFDVLGNQFERCHGWPNAPVAVLGGGLARVDDGRDWFGRGQNPAAIRGGSFSRSVGNHRSAFRFGILEFPDSNMVFGDTGFRIARTLRPANPDERPRRVELDEVYEVEVGGTGAFEVKEVTGPLAVSPTSGTLPARLRVLAAVPPGWTRPPVSFAVQCPDRKVVVARELGGRDLRLTAPGGAPVAIPPLRFEFRPGGDRPPIPFTFSDPAALPPYVLVPTIPDALFNGALPDPEWWAYPVAAARPGMPRAFGWDTATTWTVRYFDWRLAANVPAPPSAAEWADALSRPLLAVETRRPLLDGPYEPTPAPRPGPVAITLEGELPLPAGVYELAATDIGHRITIDGKVVADTWRVRWRLRLGMTNRTEFVWPGGPCRFRVETFTYGDRAGVSLDVRPLAFGTRPSP